MPVAPDLPRVADVDAGPRRRVARGVHVDPAGAVARAAPSTRAPRARRAPHRARHRGGQPRAPPRCRARGDRRRIRRDTSGGAADRRPALPATGGTPAQQLPPGDRSELPPDELICPLRPDRRARAGRFPMTLPCGPASPAPRHGTRRACALPAARRVAPLSRCGRRPRPRGRGAAARRRSPRRGRRGPGPRSEPVRSGVAGS